jgi:hypothetical protein
MRTMTLAENTSYLSAVVELEHSDFAIGCEYIAAS